MADQSRGSFQSTRPAYVRRRRAFGILKGKLQLPDSFFAPLTDAELKAWDRG
jgi:hypothetical protein